MSSSIKYWHEEVGYNFRMTNMQAAGSCSVRKANFFVKKKIEIQKKFSIKLKILKILVFQKK